jgi:TonB-linked SusC/RagA family outer membrane protein
MLFAALPLAAQGGRLTGTVTDSASGAPLAGAQIVLSGAAVGAVSSADGRYTLAGVPAGTYTLDVRRIGYSRLRIANVIVTDGGTTTRDVALAQRPFELQEQVITGVIDPTAGTKTPFTVDKVGAEDLEVPRTNALEAIQGKVAGAQVVTSGQPGSGVNIVLRSPTSISKSNSPLIVVDGVILSQSFGASSADLSALDIESYEVIKGAAAASLYGSRAANGVIQIRTRRGTGVEDSRTRISLRSELGSNSLPSRVNWAQQHFYLLTALGKYVDTAGAVVSRDARVARPTAVRFQDQPYPDQVYNQVEELFDPGEFFKNSISVSQTSPNTSWLASYATHREDGVVLNGGGYDRSDVRLNLDHRFRDNFSMQLSSSYMRSKRDELYGDAFFDFIFQPPDVNLRQPDPDGTPFIYFADPVVGEENPLYVIETEDELTRRTRVLGSLDLRYLPLSWLTLEANGSYDRSDRSTDFFLDRGFKTEGSPTGGIGEISRFNGVTNALNASVSATFLGSWRDLTGRAQLRAITEREDNALHTSEGTDLAARGVNDLNNARVVNISSSSEAIRSNGYFGVVGLDYAGKYIGDALVRRDGSSLFGPQERWHTYYRVSGAYRVSEEPWWPVPSIGEFKLRASRGTAGGRPSFEDQHETYSLGVGGTLSKNTLGNPFLKPERATENEFGLDLIALNRFAVQLTYAKSTVEDQLILVPLESAFGYESQWQNAGTVEGNTFEASLEAQLYQSASVSWRVGLIGDRSRHRVTEFDRSCFITQTVVLRCAGERLGAMYGQRFLTGTAGLAAVHANSADQFALNDDGLLVAVGPDGSYRDMNWGTTVDIDGVSYGWGMPIAQIDTTGVPVIARIGETTPDFHFGISNNVTWKGFSFYGLIDAQVGGQVYNRTKQRSYQYQRSSDVDQGGKAEAEKKPIEYYLALYNANTVNSWFVEDGGYVKLREVSVKYQLPITWLRSVSRMGISGVTVGLIGRNLLTSTEYSGYDPDIGSPILRLDDFIYPPYRTITGTVQIDF